DGQAEDRGAFCAFASASVVGNCASPCADAGSTTVSVSASAGMSALPRLVTVALKATGSPNGTAFGEAASVPVSPAPAAALDSTVKLVALVASTVPPESRTLRFAV